MNILVCKEKWKKCKNGLLKSTKHILPCDYFLHMKLAFKSRIFEPNGYKQLTIWFNKGHISLATFFLQNFKILKISYDLLLIKLN
jgi:hypothetical protein